MMAQKYGNCVKDALNHKWWEYKIDSYLIMPIWCLIILFMLIVVVSAILASSHCSDFFSICVPKPWKFIQLVAITTSFDNTLWCGLFTNLHTSHCYKNICHIIKLCPLPPYNWFSFCTLGEKIIPSHFIYPFLCLLSHVLFEETRTGFDIGEEETKRVTYIR